MGHNAKISHVEIRCEDVDWIKLTEDRDQWRAVVSADMQFVFYNRRVIYLLADL
jgi:hypothetical protein